jgi:MFS family permease
MEEVSDVDEVGGKLLGNAPGNALQSVYQTQLSMVQDFWRNKQIRPAMVVIWVASFGAALHSPVNTFFYLALGASPTDIGIIGSTISLGVFLNPIYGYLLDTQGPYLVLLASSFLCAAGCLIRGFATDFNMLLVGAAVLGLGASNLWTVTLSYVAAASERNKRSQVVSAYLFQVSFLMLAAKACYPPWNYVLENILGIEHKLLRYRIHMGICTVFCFFGVLQLLVSGSELKVSKDSESSKQEQRIDDRKPGAGVKTGQVLGFCLVAVALVAQSIAKTVGGGLWALVLNKHLGWESMEYGYVLFASSAISTIAIAVFPAVEARCGRFRTAGWALFLCGICVCLAFAHPQGMVADDNSHGAGSSNDGASPPRPTLRLFPTAVHIVLGMGFIALASFLEPSLKSLASLFMPQVLQGRTFGVLTLLAGLGEQVGHLGGGYLFEHGAKELPFFLHAVPTSISSAGTLPFVLVGILLMLSAVLILVVSSLLASELQLDNPDKAKASPPPTPDEAKQPKKMGADELSNEMVELLPKIDESCIRSRTANGMSQ